ncbi:hypothetical protein KSB_81700 [Ktedonobacter robiniae]|uniref:Uncharacterized protein n=1 Tax=Ktedonobacter robiniae TaxID=2778365 RepID=A0ABQ3V5G8_9CHLR|nr:hypothetical protein KSB_81700 [Ktedonobacter robiniae]
MLTLVLPAIMMALAALTLMPLGASAASTPAAAKSSKVHFLWRSNTSNSAKVTPFAGSNLNYYGGAVQNGTATAYAIYWEPNHSVSSGYHSLINRYFGDVGSSGLYKNNTQYTDSSGRYPSNATFGGSWTDTASYPRSPLLDSDIQKEVSRAISANGWTASTNHIFFVFTQANENLCFDSSHSQCASNAFCAYHSYFGSHTIYAAMPYAASFSCNPGSSPNHDDADQTINVTSHEQMEAATDPLLNAWYDSSGSEIGDKCAWKFGSLNSSGGDVTWNGHSYIVQKEWDNHVTGCVLTGP